MEGLILNIDNLQSEYDFLMKNCSQFYGWEDDYSLGYRRFKCRRCDFSISYDEAEVFRFCPVCGANNWYHEGLLHSKVSYDVSEVFPWQKGKWVRCTSTSENYKKHIEDEWQELADTIEE